MALTNEDKDFIRNCLAVKCQCDLSPESAAEMGHLIGSLRDLGDGNLSRGINIFSKGIVWVKAVQGRGEKIGGAVAVFLIISIVSGGLTLLGFGIRALVSGWRGVP